MSVQIISFRSIALAAPLLIWGAGIGMTANTARANECRHRPHSAPPKGSHWYYKTDRKKGRKCWFLRALEQPAHQKTARHRAAPAPSAKTSTAHSTAAKTSPAAATHAAAEAISNAPPASPPRKVQPTAVRNAPAHEPVPQRLPSTNAVPAMPAPPAPPASAPAPTGAQASAPAGAQAPAQATADTFVWPDPRPVSTIEIHKPSPVPSAARAAPVSPTAGKQASHDQASHDVTGTVHNELPAKPAVQTAASPTDSFLKVFLVVLLGLTAAGLLYHLAMRLAGMLGRRIIVDHSEFNWVEAWPEQELRKYPWQPERNHERQAFIDDPPPPLVPTAGDYSPPRPRQTDDTGHDRVFRPRDASPPPAAVGESQDSLMQLIRDLDQLLQATKQA